MKIQEMNKAQVQKAIAEINVQYSALTNELINKMKIQEMNKTQVQKAIAEIKREAELLAQQLTTEFDGNVMNNIAYKLTNLSCDLRNLQRREQEIVESETKQDFGDIAMEFVQEATKKRSLKNIKHLIKCAREHYDHFGLTEDDTFLNFFHQYHTQGYSTKFIEYSAMSAIDHLMSLA